MRISYFVPRCTPDNSHGRYAIELAKRIGKNHPVTVYSGAFWHPLRTIARCLFLPVANRPVVARLATLWIASALGTRRRQADILHTQGADAPIGNIVTAQFCNASIRLRSHKPGFFRRINYAIGAAAEKYCMSKRSTKRIIAISKQVKADIEQKYGVESGKIALVYHGVDTEIFHPRHRIVEQVSVRARLALHPEDFVVVFVGGDYRRKGLLTLLEAVKRVTGRLKVLVVGVEADAALTRVLRDSKLRELVRFVRTTADISPFYSAADCFALPTVYDTFSMATLEAMASGLPVIVSRAAAVSELLEPNTDSLFLERPDDVESLAGHLERLARDQALSVGLGMRARQTAERHSWDVVASQTVEVYREALEGSSDR